MHKPLRDFRRRSIPHWRQHACTMVQRWGGSRTDTTSMRSTTSMEKEVKTYNGQDVGWVATCGGNEASSINKSVDATSSRSRECKDISDELATEQTHNKNASLLHTIRNPA